MSYFVSLAVEYWLSHLIIGIKASYLDSTYLSGSLISEICV